MPHRPEVLRPSYESISQLIQEAEPYHEPGVVWRSKVREDAQIARGSLTIISVGDKKRIVGHSLQLAREICQTPFRERDPWPYNPEDVIEHPKVLYVNTAVSRDAIANQAMGLWPGAQEWSVKRDRQLRDNPAKDDRLSIYHVPAGDFNQHFTEIKVRRKWARAGIVIVNSFEFAARTARHRDDMVFQLLELVEMGCTVIVFSQDEKRKIERRSAGPMGLMRMQADDIFDHAIFEELTYAEPVGSTHESEEAYYESTGECGPEFFKHMRELCSPDWKDEDGNEEEEKEKDEELPDRLAAAEIKDNIHDDIELPQELVDGGVYSMDGELVCVNEGAALQTMNRYTVHTNNYQSVAHTSACAAESEDAVPVIEHR